MAGRCMDFALILLGLFFASSTISEKVSKSLSTFCIRRSVQRARKCKGSLWLTRFRGGWDPGKRRINPNRDYEFYDIADFGDDSNMTIPSMAEIVQDMKDIEERVRTGNLHSSEKSTPEPPEPEVVPEGRLIISHISRDINERALEISCKRYGPVSDFYIEKANKENIYLTRATAYITYRNSTHAEKARKGFQRKGLPGEGNAQFRVAIVAPDPLAKFDKVAKFDPDDHVYDAEFKVRGRTSLMTGQRGPNGRKRTRSTSRERLHRRQKGDIRMDKLHDFEKTKLKKLMKDFPNLVFPDNWCEDENGWTLYVGRVPLDVDGAELEKLFERFGKISQVKLGKTWEQSRKQFAFVSYHHAESACRAMDEMSEDRYRMREQQAPLDVRFAQRFVRVHRKTGNYQEAG